MVHQNVIQLIKALNPSVNLMCSAIYYGFVKLAYFIALDIWSG